VDNETTMNSPSIVRITLIVSIITLSDSLFPLTAEAKRGTGDAFEVQAQGATQHLGTGAGLGGHAKKLRSNGSNANQTRISS